MTDSQVEVKTPGEDGSSMTKNETLTVNDKDGDVKFAGGIFKAELEWVELRNPRKVVIPRLDTNRKWDDGVRKLINKGRRALKRADFDDSVVFLVKIGNLLEVTSYDTGFKAYLCSERSESGKYVVTILPEDC